MSRREKFTIVGKWQRYTAAQIRGKAASMDRRIVFLRVRSYGDGAAPGETIGIAKDGESDLSGADVLVVEDIVDTGSTLALLGRRLEGKKERSVRFCAPVDQRERRMTGAEIGFSGLHLKRGFLVGYGMDYGEAFRQFPEIHTVPLPGCQKHADGGCR